MANTVADAVGSSRNAFQKLIRQMIQRGELRDSVHFKYMEIQTAAGPRKTLVLSHMGVIRVMMRCDAPKAIPFRDWADEMNY